MAQTTDQLVQGSSCINSCIPPGMQLAVLVYLFKQIAGNTQTTDQLVQAAACINNCIPMGSQLAVLIYLAQQISGGSGGGGTAQLVTYTVGSPANPSNVNQPAIAYDPTGILPVLGWNTGTQQWV